jgi:hypothetical protein
MTSRLRVIFEKVKTQITGRRIRLYRLPDYHGVCNQCGSPVWRTDIWCTKIDITDDADIFWSIYPRTCAHCGTLLLIYKVWKDLNVTRELKAMVHHEV